MSALHIRPDRHHAHCSLGGLVHLDAPGWDPLGLPAAPPRGRLLDHPTPNGPGLLNGLLDRLDDEAGGRCSCRAYLSLSGRNARFGRPHRSARLLGRSVRHRDPDPVASATFAFRIPPISVSTTLSAR
jgi:hypothetical protein